MAKKQPKTVQVTKQTGQISATGGMMSPYLLRQMPIWNNPDWLHADTWRQFVRKQPIAVLCREAITNHLLSLDWNITSRDSEKQDELKEDIQYYTRLFERGNAFYTSMDFSNHVEWIVKDLFDLPFGAAAEIGRENDSPDGKVVWVRPLDGGTLAPTLDMDYPVVQHFPNYQPVVFPKEFISRIFLSPRTEIQREGWGMPPPERIYLAMEMLNRGDIYYSQLLLNTPEAGILDLMDMDKESATEWVTNFRDLLYGINPLKIPVLYEHTSEAKWIPFGKLPSEILYDSVTSRYISILTAGYGLTPSDIGMGGGGGNGGDTLAGTIRNERASARSGKSLAEKKTKAYFDNILPEELQFGWVNFDDEKNVALSRARMANANAASVWIANQVYTPDEIRRQGIADGMFTITIPETIDRAKIEWPTNALRYIGKNKDTPDVAPGGNKGANQIGNPKAPSGGGHGEIKPQQVVQRSRAKIEVGLAKSIYESNQILGALLNSVRNENNDFPSWEDNFDNAVVGKSMMDLVSESIIDDTYNTLVGSIANSDWFDTVSVELARQIADSIEEPKEVEEEVAKSLTEEDVVRIVATVIKSQRDEDSARQEAIDKEVQKRVMAILAQQGTVEKSIPSMPAVNLNLPANFNITAELDASKLPPAEINFSPVIQPSRATIHNNVTVEPTPVTMENTVNVPATTIENKVEVAPTPVVVENSVTVQPAEVKVELQKEDKPKEAVILRDSEGKMTGIKAK